MTTAGDRQSDVARLRSALSGLSRRSVPTGRDDRGAVGHPLTRPAPGTEPGSEPEPRPRGVNGPECRTTRASIYDYLTGRLLPHRRRRFELHLDGCAECTRAFTDVREVSWRHRYLGRRLVTAEHEGGRHRRTLRHVSAATG